MSYEFSSVTASNGIQLDVIKTTATNIELQGTRSTVPNSTFFGINGGFFDSNNQLLSIAVNNDIPASGFGGGLSNAGEVPRGTFVWDGALRNFGVPVVQRASEIAVSNNRSNFWAQGGISLDLQSTPDDWERQALAENINNIGGLNSLRNRSGLFYTRPDTVWLVITQDNATPAQFRSAVIERLSPRDGILLDGGDSTQMECNQLSYSNRGRIIPQIVALIDKTDNTPPR